MRSQKRSLLLLLLGLGACTGDLRDEQPPDGMMDPVDGKITVTQESAGVFRLVVDASDTEAWVYFDLGGQKPVGAPSDLTTSRDWDLAFRRFTVKSNGGVSGPGAVGVAPMPDVTFDSVARAPATGWLEDQPKEGGAEVDYTFNVANAASENGWYLYDPVEHVLSPAPIVYAIRSVDGAYFKLEFVRYYDDAGSPAHLTLRLAAIDPPDQEAGIAIDAGSGAWVYLRLDGSTVAVADAATSREWDFAISRTRMRTNSGTSGPGSGGAAWAEEGSAFASISEVSTIGYTIDAVLPVAGPPGSGSDTQNPTLSGWYNYDPVTHTVSPKDRVLLVRGASGAAYAKLSILEYEDGTYRVEVGAITAAPLVAEQTITATGAEVWVHLDLRTGAIVSPAVPGEDLGWDVAFSRTRVRTNGGTSGSGEAAAIEMAVPMLAEVGEAPADGYTEDVILPNPGPPGSGEFSGNPVLNGWYSYDPATHQLSVREVVFAIRTADGDFAKLKVRAYDEGVYAISWAYAGPERRTF